MLYRKEVLSTHPPKDGTWCKLICMGSTRTVIAQFDKSAYGGKGGWFTDKNHALKEESIHDWEIY